MFLLPSLKNKITLYFSQLYKKISPYFAGKRGRYKAAIVLDLFLIFLILINGQAPAQRMMTPLVSSVKTYYSVSKHRATKENFAFVPGWARNKYSEVDIKGLTYLSFFDVPLTKEGEINRESRGYASFVSAEAWELFERARYGDTKVLLTLSAGSAENVKSILDNGSANLLAEAAAEEISAQNLDGIVLDFEFSKNGAINYREKFTQFITAFTKRLHEVSPDAFSAVAVPSSALNNDSLYNIEGLEKSTDKVFLIAADFIVPEVKNNAPENPVYGYSSNQYWEKIAALLGSLEQRIPADKLVMERAWYGNGDNYPLYIPQDISSGQEHGAVSSMEIDEKTLEGLADGVPAKGKQAARKNIPIIAKALSDEGILDSNVLAYALATIEHETDETFEPIAEIQGSLSARRLGYEGGANYYGRGFIQITHLRNYRTFGERIGMGEELVKRPELASDPVIAAKILAAYFKDNNVANLASSGNFVAARTPINPDYNGYSIASLAYKYGIY